MFTQTSIPEIKTMQETIDKRLGLLESTTIKKLNEANQKMINKALMVFDALNQPRLMAEARKLAGGAGTVSDAAVPAIFERTVLREALSKLVGLKFADASVSPFGPSISIPYSYRDTTAAGPVNSRVYEGQEIPRAGVIQATEEAYPIPQKMAFELSDELRLLTSARTLEWDAVKENINNATRIIQEDTDQLILNEMLLASDEYGATAVSNEDLELQADGNNRVFPLANFPVVRPRTTYNLQGAQIGSTVNPVTVTYNSATLSEYDGTGIQPAGIYFSLNYNLGEIYLVDESGAILTPANGTAYTISYSYASNRYNFDTDEGSVETAIHWDTFLYRYGLRKAELADSRYHDPDFGLMSGVAMNQVEQARKFASNFVTPGTDLNQTGDLGKIKDIPNWKTRGPGIYFRDERVLIGESGNTRFRLLKPWEMTAIENQRGPNGRFTGKKEAYGDQWVVVHTPSQLKRAYTSIVLYSGTGRVSRVDP